MSQRAKTQLNEKNITSMIAIINSMTLHERHFPIMIKNSRKRRIAKGSGTKVLDVNRLLKQFARLQKMIKQHPKQSQFDLSAILRWLLAENKPTHNADLKTALLPLTSKFQNQI